MASPTQQEVTKVIEAQNRAEQESDFADTVQMEPAQIEGTRYKYILTNAADPRN